MSLLGLVVLAFVAGVAACSSEEPGATAPNPNGKVEGTECTDGSECASLTCSKGKCTAVTGANPTNKIKDGDETDVDCGGKSAPPCVDGKACAAGSDCQNGICTGNVCKAPTSTDGVKNGDETDVDCGGTTTKAPKCGNDKGCAKSEDCSSGACSYAKKCVEFPSCVGHFGGDTCGAGETGAADAKHESCCATATLSDGTRVGKYEITAGRMRAFVERFNGNLQTWAATNPTGWNAGWNDQLPASMDDVNNHLGPVGKCGCNVGNQALGGRTYWQQEKFGAEDYSDFPKDVMDEKSLNCIQWHMVQALCHFDGGRLVNSEEVRELITNNGAGQYPWSFQDQSQYDVAAQDDRVVHRNSYETPNPPANMRQQGGGPLDRSFWMAPPGRRPEGYNKLGVADAVGNMMDWVADGEKKVMQTISWENHPLTLNQVADWKGGACGPSAPEGYYAIGGRCAFPK